MTIPELPIDFKYSTLGGPERDYTVFEAWKDSTNGILIFGEWLDVYCDELDGPLELVLSGAATAPNYYRVIRLIGDSSKVTIRVEENNSYVIRWYDVLCWIADNPDQPARPQEGDVVDTRPTGVGFTGSEERKLFVIATVDMSEAEAEQLKKPFYDGGITPDPLSNDQTPVVHGYRYKLPLAKLKEKVPDLDIAKIKDPTLIYQPFEGGKPHIFSTNDKKALFYDKHKKGFRFKDGAVPIRLAEME